MQIRFHKSFLKKYNKLSLCQRKLVDEALDKFAHNPFEKSLKNHALKGRLKGLRSISVAFDLRLVFLEKDHYLEVLFVNVGSHNQVY